MEIYLAGAMACYGSESNEAKKWREKAKEYFLDGVSLVGLSVLWTIIALAATILKILVKLCDLISEKLEKQI